MLLIEVKYRYWIMKVFMALLCTICTIEVNSYRILLIPCSVSSHHLLFTRLGEELIKHGHDIVYLIGDKDKNVPSNILKMGFDLKRYHMKTESGLDSEFIKSWPTKLAFSKSTFETLSLMKEGLPYFENDAIQILYDNETLESLKKENLDFAVIDSIMVYHLLVPYKLNIPFASFGFFNPHLIRRVPYLPSYVPGETSHYSDRMTLGERFRNTLQFFLMDVMFYYKFGRNDFSKEYVPEMPATSLVNLLHNASLFIKLTGHGLEYPRPSMPDIIPFGHLMARPAKPLTTEFKEIMDNSNGVILVSFGSLARTLPQQIFKKLIHVFTHLQYDVILKSSLPLESVPENVHLVKWMPQNDLLAHPKLKLFITHGGLNSMIESIYNAVPLLAFPLGLDQFANAAYIQSNKYGKIMNVASFTEEELLDEINEVMNDQTYSTNIEKTSSVIKDMQKNNVSNPVFWIEHVIKYGAEHLRSAAYDMPLYQYLLLDVIALGIFFVIALLAVIYPFVKLFCRLYGWSCASYKNVGRLN